jgi:hypothetical protein
VYSDIQPDNHKLISTLQPAAEFAWRRQFDPSHGKFTGGILLQEWATLLRDAADAALACDKADSKCSGASNCCARLVKHATIASPSSEQLGPRLHSPGL